MDATPTLLLPIIYETMQLMAKGKKVKLVTPNIFEYSNYREYLSDYFEYKKSLSKGFSHRVFVRVCGFSSPNFLKLVMDGKRNLGKEALEKLITYLNLTKPESEYLRTLIAFNQAKKYEDRNRHLTELAQLAHRAKVKQVDVEQYDYFSKWYYVAIRELVALDDFVEEANWINKKLTTRLSNNTIHKIIEILLDLNLLKRDAYGKLIQVESSIVCTPEIFSVAVSNYHKEMLDMAASSLKTSRSNDRDISGLTVSVDRETFDKMRKVVERCRREIHHISSTTKEKKVVCQINFQLFNISEASWK